MTTSYHTIEQAIDDFAAAARRAESLVHTQARPGEFTKALELVVIARKRLNSLIVIALTPQQARK